VKNYLSKFLTVNEEKPTEQQQSKVVIRPDSKKPQKKKEEVQIKLEQPVVLSK
jgi:hypothetical protein